jgi:hypothetical protein
MSAANAAAEAVIALRSRSREVRSLQERFHVRTPAAAVAAGSG